MKVNCTTVLTMLGAILAVGMVVAGCGRQTSTPAQNPAPAPARQTAPAQPTPAQPAPGPAQPEPIEPAPALSQPAPTPEESLSLIALSHGGNMAPAAEIVKGEITTLAVNQENKTDGMMEGIYYGYFFDQWPWKGGSEGMNTTLGPVLDSGSIRAEIDVCIEKAELRTGRLRFSVACGSWKGPGDVYKATEYDFWNGPRLDSGVVWTDTVRVHKGPQLGIGKWEHISIDLSSLIGTSFAAQNYLQAIYAVIEWDGNNTSALKFKNFKVYRTLKKG